MLSSDISSGSSHSDSVQWTRLHFIIVTTVNCSDSSELQEDGASEGGASKVWLPEGGAS